MKIIKRYSGPKKESAKKTLCKHKAISGCFNKAVKSNLKIVRCDGTGPRVPKTKKH